MLFRDKFNEPDGSKSHRLTIGEWSWHDNYFGGNPFGGREVVFQDGKPLWMMTYYGLVLPSYAGDPKIVFTILKHAMAANDDWRHTRGISDHQEGDWRYMHNITHAPNRVAGDEVIVYKGRVVYEGQFAGGFVNLS